MQGLASHCEPYSMYLHTLHMVKHFNVMVIHGAMQCYGSYLFDLEGLGVTGREVSLNGFPIKMLRLGYMV